MTCTFLLVSVSHLPTTSLQATERLWWLWSLQNLFTWLASWTFIAALSPHWLTSHQKTRESMSLLEQKKKKERKKKKENILNHINMCLIVGKRIHSLSPSLHRWRSIEMKWSFIFVLVTLYRMASLESMLMTKNLTDFISSSCFQSPYNSTRPSKCSGNMVFNTTFLHLVWCHLWEQ